MALDPRFNFVVKCPQTSAKQQGSNSARKDFFSAVGKVGDIELLNAVGDGSVASGLRSLASASDSIRGGDTNSAIITADADQGGNAGANFVFDAVGINSQSAQEAGRFNPGVLNVATAEAKGIFDRVKQGNYKLEDIPGSFQNIQNLSTLIGGIFTPGADENKKLELCGAKNYAQSLIRFAPKHKYMFVLQFTLNREYNEWDDFLGQMAFVVKNMGRPNINVEHEEVNMYNFWTRIPKRVAYEPITMRFYDDTKNYGHSFFAAYLEAISPIARRGGYESNDLMNHQFLEDSGLKGSSRASTSSASLGSLEGNNTTIIDELKVFHLYDYGRYMSVYNYKNPKILTMNLDDLDMAEGATGNEIEFQFAYDALHITPVLSVQDEIETVRDISGRWIDADSYIDPVFQQGPSSSDEAGGITKIPDTKEQSFVGKLQAQGEAFLEQGDAFLDSAVGTANSFVDTAQQTAGKIYNDTSDAVSSALDGFDSAGGGDS